MVSRKRTGSGRKGRGTEWDEVREKDYEYAFRKGVATGSASAFSERLATNGEVNDLIGKVTIIR